MSTADIRVFTPEDRDWVIAQHSKYYALEAGFDHTFGRLVAKVIDDFLAKYDASVDRGWMAEFDGSPVGCIFCMQETSDVARLRLFFLVPEARGLGLGRRLLHQCMAFSASAGRQQMVLATHESHAAACALYRATGWVLEQSEAVHSFGQDLIEQHWRYRF